ncbi:hypothetical protein JD969_11570 [Planctomycetota bacterium]|nr:hypothetical protein JD969_11570 [Planctomycetota bacterium]
MMMGAKFWMCGWVLVGMIMSVSVNVHAEMPDIVHLGDVFSYEWDPGYKPVPVITIDTEDRSQYLGQYVCVKGFYGRDKAPMVAGVQVDVAMHLIGKEVLAWGVLDGYAVNADPNLKTQHRYSPTKQYWVYTLSPENSDHRTHVMMQTPRKKTRVLKKGESLETRLDDVVIIKGIAEDDLLCGVHVEVDDELIGKQVRAIGVLKKYVFGDVRAPQTKRSEYSLTNIETGKKAVVKFYQRKNEPVIIISEDQLLDNIGEVVTLLGKTSEDKSRSLLGMSMYDKLTSINPKGVTEATGILELSFNYTNKRKKRSGAMNVYLDDYIDLYQSEYVRTEKELAANVGHIVELTGRPIHVVDHPSGKKNLISIHNVIMEVDDLEQWPEQFAVQAFGILQLRHTQTEGGQSVSYYELTKASQEEYRKAIEQQLQ